METRANYVLIGAFTLAGHRRRRSASSSGSRSSQIDRQYDYYDILFDNVVGPQPRRRRALQRPARRPGALARARPERVRARCASASRWPPTPRSRADTERAAAGAGRDRRLLRLADRRQPRRAAAARQRSAAVPVIPAERSVVEALTEDAPDLRAEAIALLRELQTFVGPENQAYVAGILGNLDQASGAARDRARRLLVDLRHGRERGRPDRRLHRPARRDRRLGRNDARDRRRRRSKVAEGAFAAGRDDARHRDGTLDSAGRTFDSADAVIRDQVPGIVARPRRDRRRRCAAAVADLDDRGARHCSASSAPPPSPAGDRLDRAARRPSPASTPTLAEADDDARRGRRPPRPASRRWSRARARRWSPTRARRSPRPTTSIAAIDRVVAEDVPAIVADVRARGRDREPGDRPGRAPTSPASPARLEPLTASADTTLAAATADLPRRQRHARPARHRDGHRRAHADRRRGDLHRRQPGHRRGGRPDRRRHPRRRRPARRPRSTEVSADLPGDHRRAPRDAGARQRRDRPQIETVVATSGPPVQRLRHHRPAAVHPLRPGGARADRRASSASPRGSSATRPGSSSAARPPTTGDEPGMTPPPRPRRAPCLGLVRARRLRRDLVARHRLRSRSTPSS